MPDGVMKFGVGQPVRRLEDDRFLRGIGRYVDDISHPGQLHAYVLRSPYAHAVLRSVDVSAARTAPGVHAVYTYADTVAFGVKDIAPLAPVKNADGSPIANAPQPHLATDRLRYVGQPIAFIVADSRAQAHDAAEAVELEVVELPSVTDGRAALSGDAADLHDHARGNLCFTWETGDAAATEAGFAAAAHVSKVSLNNQRVIVNAMEPRAINATYDAEVGRWTIHCATQGSHNMRARLSDALSVAPDRIRVITPDVGGGFGMKLMIHPEYALAAMAAKQLGRPVKWTADRTESFISDVQGRDVRSEAEIALDADGLILAMRARSISNLGAYCSQVGAAIHTLFSGDLIGGMYRVPAAHVAVRGAFTNATPTDAYRGAGRPEINFLTERLIEQAARDLGLAPAELRRRNLLTAADMPYALATGGGVYDSGDCVATLDKALAAADYAGESARRAAAEAEGRLFGVGVAYYMERTGGGPVENARIRVRADGRVEAMIGTQSNGQGHETAWAQLIHEKLGIDPSRMDFLLGDSDALPAGGGTGGSRSLVMAHRTFFLAADDVIEKGKVAASDLLEAAVADIEFSAAEGGLFRVAGTDRTVDLFAAAERATDPFGEAALWGEGEVNSRTSTFPNGAHIAEVEIDPQTGWPRLRAYTIVDDFGVVLNPLLVGGQVHGGVAQGVGQALFEGAAFDPDSGQPLTGSFMDYQMPRAADLPLFETTLTADAPCQTNPLGVKGCGEAGSVGATPAVVLAVLDALHSQGVETIDMPMTPLTIWSALRAAADAEA